MIGQGAAAFSIALLSALALGPALLPWLRRFRLGQTIRSDGPARHLAKSGTPTMGGLVFVPAIAIGVIAAGAATFQAVAVLIVTAAFGAIGLIDDYSKVARRRSLGLRARTKLLISLLISIGLGYAVLSRGGGTALAVPFSAFEIELGVAYVPFVAFVMLSVTNAVNLADGLDGLASGLTLVAAAGYAVALWVSGRTDLVVVALALAGASAGFLPMNRHPAAMFMGDTGSFALGGALGAIAVLSGTELILPIVGGVFVLETISVIAQVVWFKITGRRLLLMSPIHHHLELLGWSETVIVRRMLAGGLACAVIAVVAAHTL